MKREFKSLVANVEDGSISLKCEIDGADVDVVIPPSHVSNAIAALHAAHNSKAKKRKAQTIYPLQPVGTTPTAYANGLLGLSFSLPSGIRFDVAIPQQAIQALRASLLELERLYSPTHRQQ